MVGDSNDETNFPHQFLLTNTQVSRLQKPWEFQLSRTQHSGGFLSRLLGPLL